MVVQYYEGHKIIVIYIIVIQLVLLERMGVELQGMIQGILIKK